ncbi:hypothetical protein KBD61_05455 [Patescibacteria group bacterium]|nr:hypothetical protein [Patescibacteria group bacterium]MBP9710437.1 hypothetical protein [Patescibacteria group bacterium]
MAEGGVPSPPTETLATFLGALVDEVNKVLRGKCRKTMPQVNVDRVITNIMQQLKSTDLTILQIKIEEARLMRAVRRMMVYASDRFTVVITAPDYEPVPGVIAYVLIRIVAAKANVHVKPLTFLRGRQALSMLYELIVACAIGYLDANSPDPTEQRGVADIVVDDARVAEACKVGLLLTECEPPQVRRILMAAQCAPHPPMFLFRLLRVIEYLYGEDIYPADLSLPQLNAALDLLNTMGNAVFTFNPGGQA